MHCLAGDKDRQRYVTPAVFAAGAVTGIENGRALQTSFSAASFFPHTRQGKLKHAPPLQKKFRLKA
jgi:hypothetical protein